VSQPHQVLSLAGKTLDGFDELLPFLQTQRASLSKEEYRDLRSETGALLNNVSLGLDQNIRRVFNFFAKDDDWATFRRSPEYKDSWTQLEKRAETARKNQTKYDNAAAAVKANWGERGEALLELNHAHQFTRSLGQLARKYKQYDEAMLRLCQSVHWRLANPSPGRSSSCDLGHSDLRRVIDEPEEYGPNPLKPEELSAINCHIGPLGLLEHGRVTLPSGFVTEVGEEGEQGEQGEQEEQEEQEQEGSVMAIRDKSVPEVQDSQAAIATAAAEGEGEGGIARELMKQLIEAQSRWQDQWDREHPLDDIPTPDDISSSAAPAPALPAGLDGDSLGVQMDTATISTTTKNPGDNLTPEGENPGALIIPPKDVDPAPRFENAENPPASPAPPPPPLEPVPGVQNLDDMAGADTATIDPAPTLVPVPGENPPPLSPPPPPPPPCEPVPEVQMTGTTVTATENPGNDPVSSENPPPSPKHVPGVQNLDEKAGTGTVATPTENPGNKPVPVPPPPVSDECHCRIYAQSTTLGYLDAITEPLDVKMAVGLLIQCGELLGQDPDPEDDSDNSHSPSPSPKEVSIGSGDNTKSSSPPICRKHLIQLGKAIGLRKASDSDLLKRLQTCGEEPAELPGLYSDPETRLWFQRKVLPKQQRNKLLPYRFSVDRGLVETAGEIDVSLIVRDLATHLGLEGQDFLADYTRFGSIDIHGILDWWFGLESDGPSLADLARQEIRMYIHHTRHAGIDEELTPQWSPWISTQLYSHCQQLLAQDPLLYILNVCIRPGHNPRLIFYPEPAFAADGSTEDLPLSFHEATVKGLASGSQALTSADHIRVTVPLSSETADDCNMLIPEMRTLIRPFWKFLSEKYGEKEAKTFNLFEESDIEAFAESQNKNANLSPSPSPIRVGAIRICDPLVPQGTIGEKPRFVLTATLVGINQALTKLVPARLGRLDSHLQALQALARPDHHLLAYQGNLAKEELYHPFPAAFRLPPLSPIGGAIMGLKSWADIDVVTECRVLLGPDRTAAWEIIDKWRQQAKTTMIQEYDRLRELEKSLYKNKSYSHISIAPEDIVTISSDEELETDEEETDEEDEGYEDEGKGGGERGAEDKGKKTKGKSKKKKVSTQSTEKTAVKRELPGNSPAKESPRKKRKV
jgi:hypothetical protein